MNRFASGRFGSTPPVTKNLVIINVGLWLISILALRMFRVNLNFILGLMYFQSPLFKPWQIVTHMFMHDNQRIFHLFFNMWALWMFGKVLESVWGSRRFLIYFLITGLGAALVHTLVNYIQLAPYVAALKEAYSVDRINMALLNEILQPGNPWYQVGLALRVPTVGASGAVYGVLLAFGMLFPNTPLMIIPIPVPIKAKWLIIAAAVISLYLGLSGQGGNIAHFAHLGGMVFGFFIVRYWRKNSRTFY